MINSMLIIFIEFKTCWYIFPFLKLIFFFLENFASSASAYNASSASEYNASSASAYKVYASAYEGDASSASEYKGWCFE